MGDSRSLDSSLLELQLSEMEMLQSMFPQDGEFEVDDPITLTDVKDYVDGKTEEVPLQISFALKISTEEAKSGKEDFELICSLPHQYPNTEPDIFIRCQLLSRQQQRQINEDLLSFIASLERGDICIGEAVQWVQDNREKYISESSAAEACAPVETEKPEVKDETFTRLWIHSHHIRSKFKRRDLLDMAADMALTGFCLPGKPGIICVEGYKEICDDFWHAVRRWTWKKISCKHREDFPLVDEGKTKTLNDFRYFDSFKEIAFDAHGFHGRDYHMDLGKFYQYLEERNCGYVFKILLGVEGKVSTS
ncbi:RWD domain-containing protein 2B-like [Ptychodera flava]|uniref:RWD domain-containing protein 2B-like n=1 Tax=Ptychodera flava TaxID=63121 RepID=UPI00396A317B